MLPTSIICGQPPQAIDVPTAVARLHSYFATRATSSYAWRKRQLDALLALVTDNEQELRTALCTDLHTNLHTDLHRPLKGDGAGEIFNVQSEVRETLSQLAGWMAAERVQQMPHTEPFGVLLIVAPLNYPIWLLLHPLIAVIAAGNAAVLKPSELTPTVSAAMARLIPQYLDQQAFAVVQGDIESMAH